MQDRGGVGESLRCWANLDQKNWQSHTQTVARPVLPHALIIPDGVCPSTFATVRAHMEVIRKSREQFAADTYAVRVCVLSCVSGDMCASVGCVESE
jgi:hypothetical protein